MDGWNDGRIAAAARYAELGLGEHVVTPAVAPGARHIYHLYVVRSQEREQLMRRASTEAGVASGHVLHDAAAPAAGLRAPRVGRGLASR